MSEALAVPYAGRSHLGKPPVGGVYAAAVSGSMSPPASTSGSTEELIKRLQSGDDTALEGLIEATQAMAYRLAFSILRQRELCKDVLQDVYLIVYQKIGQLREPAAMRGWFSQIVVNRCRQELRGKKTSPLDDVPEIVCSSDGMAERIDSRVDVTSAMHTLAVADQAVLTLREVLDLSYHEIATTLEVPVGTVRSRIFNARQRLLAALTGQKRRN